MSQSGDQRPQRGVRVAVAAAVVGALAAVLAPVVAPVAAEQGEPAVVLADGSWCC